MTAEQTEALIRRWFTEVWAEAREEAIDELLSEDAVIEDLAHPGIRTRGREQFKEFFHMVHDAFTELRILYMDVLAQPGRYAIRVDFEAFHSGKFWGIPATHKRVRYSVSAFGDVRDGRLHDGWNLWDQLGLLRQLGAVP